MSNSASSPGTRRIIQGLSALTGLLIAGGLWFQFFRDETPVPIPGSAAAALVPAEPSVPDEENGLLLLVNSLDQRKWPVSNVQQFDILSGKKPWDAAAMRSLLEAAEDLKNFVDAALKLPAWHDNEYRDRVSSVALKWKTEIFRAKAMELAENGHMTEAMDWLATAHALAVRCMEKNPDISAVMHVSGPLRGIRFTNLRLLGLHQANREVVAQALRIVQSPVLDFRELRQSLRRTAWSAVEEFPGKEINSKGECPVVSALRGLNPAKVPDWVILSRYKPGATHNLLLRHFDQLGQTGFQEGRAARAAMLQMTAKIEEESKASVWSANPNRTGKILAAGIIQQSMHLESNYFMPLESVRRCEEAVLAAKLYAMDHSGQRPESLDRLVPEYLAAIPLDPYDGQPIKWAPHSAMAWVVGDDGTMETPTVQKGVFSSPDTGGAWARLP